MTNIATPSTKTPNMRVMKFTIGRPLLGNHYYIIEWRRLSKEFKDGFFFTFLEKDQSLQERCIQNWARYMRFKKGSGGKKSFCNTSIICTYSILLEWEPLERQPLWFSCWPSFSHSETQCFLLTFPHSYDLYDTIMPCLQHRPSLVSTTNWLHSLIKFQTTV